ncbi:MAG: DUF2177 family protein [Candidatus Pacebacteria bacterium]|nr:DUF2177 family protein [Candidatus Paceibacterota bacterium]
MRMFAITYLWALLTLVVIDGLWLFLTKSVYTNHLAHLLSGTVRWFPVALFYVLYAAGIIFLIVIPLVEQGASTQKIAFMGAFLGLVAYGTYDLTNWATIKNWPPFIVGIDLLWGACLTMLVSMCCVFMARLFE